MDIIGKAIGCEQAPPGGWGLKTAIFRRRFDALFDMHDIPGRIKSGMYRQSVVNRMYDRVKKYGIPLYSLEAWRDSPCIRYPIEDIKEHFGIDYFTSSIEYMIALAIYKGVKEINIWGIWLKKGEPHHRHLPAVSFWLGIAHARGIKVKVMTKTEIFELDEMYGYFEKPELMKNFIGACPNPQVQ